jgi:hypothetical protein
MEESQGTSGDGWRIEGLKIAVHVNGTLNNPTDTGRGWPVEIAMPWSTLRRYAHRTAPPDEGDQWRINFPRGFASSESGDRYAVLTGRHHEGVALWNTQKSDLNGV